MSDAVAYIVDDDESIRELLTWLMRRDGIRAAAFATAAEFLEARRDEGPACLILDLHMPGMGGLELQTHLAQQGIALPIVFLSGRADVPKAVHAVKSGAVDFIEKPFDYKRIVEVVRECLARDAAARAERERARRAAERMATLSHREREVLDRVVSGKPNRVIAEELDISIKTVEAHRARIMEKLGAGSLAELVQRTMPGGA
jgi:two-component system response regulator TtrR